MMYVKYVMSRLVAYFVSGPIYVDILYPSPNIMPGPIS